MPIDNENWQRWRGAIDEKMETHTMKIEDHCERLSDLEKRVGDILVKLAVPLFMASATFTASLSSTSYFAPSKVLTIYITRR